MTEILHGMLLYSEAVPDLIFVEIATTSLETGTLLAVKYNSAIKSSNINKPIQPRELTINQILVLEEKSDTNRSN